VRARCIRSTKSSPGSQCQLSSSTSTPDRSSCRAIHSAQPGEPMPIGSPELDALVGHHASSRSEFRALIREYVAAGGGAAGRAAFLRAFLALLRRSGAEPVVARRTAPGDIRLRLRGRDAPSSGLDVLVGVADDPLEILRLGHPNFGSSCLDCVTGLMRGMAQDYVLHPRVAVLYVWRARPDGGRGERLARISVMLTDAGLFLLTSHVITDRSLDFPRAFRAYLDRWATDLDRPVLIMNGQHRQLGLDRSDLRPAREPAVLPAEPATGVHTFYADSLDGVRPIRLPYVVGPHQMMAWWPGAGDAAPDPVAGPGGHPARSGADRRGGSAQDRTPARPEPVPVAVARRSSQPAAPRAPPTVARPGTRALPRPPRRDRRPGGAGRGPGPVGEPGGPRRCSGRSR
jgi:hypothetical protein